MDGEDEVGDAEPVAVADGPGGIGVAFEADLKRMAELISQELERCDLARLEDGAKRPEAKAMVDMVVNATKGLERINHILKQMNAARVAAERERLLGDMGADERDRIAERVAERIEEIIARRTGDRSAERDGDAGGGERAS